jgi:hypothetical protein
MKRNRIYAGVLLFAMICALSCEDILLEDISDDKVSLNAPADSVVTDVVNHTFSWEEMVGATSFQLTISDGGVALVDTTVTDNLFSIRLEKGEYQWCVRGLNSEYESPYVCRYLEIVEKVPDDISKFAIKLTAPANGVRTKNRQTVFIWEELEGVDQYRLLVVAPTMASPDTIWFNDFVATTSHTMTLDTGKYQWCVRGVNSKYSTDYSCRTLEVLK